jgi:hypothetical protein
MFFFVIAVVALIIAIWIAYQLLFGVAILSMFAFWVLKGIGKLLGLAVIPAPVREIIGEPLTDHFKANARGKMAPDMWTDGLSPILLLGDGSGVPLRYDSLGTR